MEEKWIKLTDPTPCQEVMFTQWGAIPCLAWCHLEAARINKPDKTKVIERDGQCWVEVFAKVTDQTYE